MSGAGSLNGGGHISSSPIDSHASPLKSVEAGEKLNKSADRNGGGQEDKTNTVSKENTAKSSKGKKDYKGFVAGVFSGIAKLSGKI